MINLECATRAERMGGLQVKTSAKKTAPRVNGEPENGAQSSETFTRDSTKHTNQNQAVKRRSTAKPKLLLRAPRTDGTWLDVEVLSTGDLRFDVRQVDRERARRTFSLGFAIVRAGEVDSVFEALAGARRHQRQQNGGR